MSDTDGHIFSDLDLFELSNDVVTSETNNESSAAHLLPATDHSGKNFTHLEINQRERTQSESCVTFTSSSIFFNTNAQNVIPSAVSSLSFSGFTSSAPTSVLSSSQGITYSTFPSLSINGNALPTSKPICHNVNYRSNTLQLSSQSNFFRNTSNSNTGFFGTGLQPPSSRINEPHFSFQRTSNTVPSFSQAIPPFSVPLFQNYNSQTRHTQSNVFIDSASVHLLMQQLYQRSTEPFAGEPQRFNAWVNSLNNRINGGLTSI